MVRPRDVLAAAVGAAVVLFPWLPGVRESLVVHANLSFEYALIAVSLVILTGWVGQISLAQGSFVGIGAFATGLPSPRSPRRSPRCSASSPCAYAVSTSRSRR
ncbi:MAG: hypothetical protein E6G68_09300 [Actinobacteria bacterium]|nr:MAG: hypothetical protein E6G68_09300 [Actinomycetota bacterium]